MIQVLQASKKNRLHGQEKRGSGHWHNYDEQTYELPQDIRKGFRPSLLSNVTLSNKSSSWAVVEGTYPMLAGFLNGGHACVLCIFIMRLQGLSLQGITFGWNRQVATVKTGLTWIFFYHIQMTTNTFQK